MNGLDYVIVVFVAVGAIYGVSRGALRMLTSLASVACGIFLASIYYAVVAGLIEPHLGLSSAASAVIAYIALFVAVFAAIEYSGRFLIRVVTTVHLSWMDRLAGGALGAATMAVVVGLGIMMLTALLPPNATTVRGSRLAPKLLAYNQELVRYLPSEVESMYLKKRAELARFWNRHSSRVTSMAERAGSAMPTSTK